MDYLVPAMESRDDDWKFPNITLLKKLQYARAPSYDILQEYEVREIVVENHQPTKSTNSRIGHSL